MATAVDLGDASSPYGALLVVIRLAPFSHHPSVARVPLCIECTLRACAHHLLGAGSIHPRDKQPIGDRLHLEARRIAYGESGLLSRGPQVLSAVPVRPNDRRDGWRASL